MPSPGKRRANEPRHGRTVRRDMWHAAFAQAMKEHGPTTSFRMLFEVLLTLEPQRADILLLRRRGRRSNKAKILRRLWPLLADVTLLDYKSPVDSSFRPGDLLRLVGYGIQYHTEHLAKLASPEALTLALVLPSIVPTLRVEIERMMWRLSPLGEGYSRIDGGPYAIFVAEIDEVCKAEKDTLLEVFSRRRSLGETGAAWLRQWVTEATMKRRNVKNTQGLDEMMRKLLQRMPVELRLEGLDPEQRLAGLDPEQRLAGLDPEQRLAGLDPEQRLAGLDPEQRLAGLDPEHEVLALSPPVLRALSEEYIQSLPADVQKEVKRRLRRARTTRSTSRPKLVRTKRTQRTQPAG